MLFLSVRSATVSEQAPSVLIREVTASSWIRTSHPSGSRPWGCSSPSRHPAPGSFEPQKIVSTLACPSGREPCGSRHRSVARRRRRRPTPRGLRTEAYPLNLRFPTAGRMRRWPNQVWWLPANPMVGSPPQPIHFSRSCKGLVHVKRDLVAQNVVTRPGEFVRHGLDRDDPMATRALALIVTLDHRVIIPFTDRFCIFRSKTAPFVIPAFAGMTE